MNQKKAGVLLSYGQTILSTLISLTYTPVMLRLLGQSEYGLYTLVNGFVSNLSPVSYTHLDVYKRQPPRCSRPAPFAAAGTADTSISSARKATRSASACSR